MSKTKTFRERITSGIVILLGLVILGCAMTACSKDKEEPIGKWDPMKWKTDVSMNDKGVVSVPSNGGTYVFNCTNYNNVWISTVWEKTVDGKEEVYPQNGENGDYNSMETSWGKVTVAKECVTIELYPNQTTQRREYVVSVTAGDIFHHFNFDQAAR